MGSTGICTRPGCRPCLRWLRLNGIIDGNLHSLPHARNALTPVAHVTTSLSWTANTFCKQKLMRRQHNLRVFGSSTFSSWTAVCRHLLSPSIHALDVQHDSLREGLGTLMTSWLAQTATYRPRYFCKGLLGHRKAEAEVLVTQRWSCIRAVRGKFLSLVLDVVS